MAFTKKCAVCLKTKPAWGFDKDSRLKDGRRSQCKVCRSKTNEQKRRDDGERIRGVYRDWYARNAERLREKQRDKYHSDLERGRERVRDNARKRYQKDPRGVVASTRNRRALLKGVGGKITAKQWEALKALYGNACLCCKRKEPEINLELDHVVPLAHGGSHSIENAQPLCKSCNSSKQARIVDYRETFVSGDNNDRRPY